MIIVLKSDTSVGAEEALSSMLSLRGIVFSRMAWEGCTVYVCPVCPGEDVCQMIRGFSFVEKLIPFAERPLRCESGGAPFEYSGITIGRDLCVIAGPCAVQEDQDLEQAASKAASAGARMFRAGAFKPRTSPYAFQGLGAEAIGRIVAAGKKSGLPTVCEIPSEAYLDSFRDIDILQVGARNMQNFELLKALGRCGKPVLLKRGAGCTVDELLFACEYIFSGGNERVILCERGIRTFENVTRNTLDVSAVAVLKKRTGLPVFADPSHAAGDRSLVGSLSLAAVAAGADGLMIEASDSAEKALSDSAQAIDYETLSVIIRKAFAIREML